MDTVVSNDRSIAGRAPGRDATGRSAPGQGEPDAYDAREPAPAWSRQQAEAWRQSERPAISPWRVVAAQAAAGVACAAVAAVVVQRGGAVASALWGAACVVLPSALLARGMTRGTRQPVAAAIGFMFWESLKIGVAIAMMAIAGKVVANLVWPVLLVTMIVCIKVNWLALLGRGPRRANPAAKA